MTALKRKGTIARTLEFYIL